LQRRVRLRQRPCSGSSDLGTEAINTHVWRFGAFEVDARSLELRRGGARVKIRQQSFQILVHLLEHAGEVVTRDELCRVLWPADTFVDFEHSLNTAIKKLRAALGDSAEAPLYIETIPKRGYRFIARVESAENGASLDDEPPSKSVADSGAIQPKRSVAQRFLPALTIVALLAVMVGAGLGYWRWRSRSHARAPHIESLAVIPLVNLSNDPEQEYFADGMTDTLITNLAQLGSLRVISRTSAMHYKGTGETLPQIARELKVDAIIEGTVQRSGNRVQVTAKLIPAQTDAPIWARSYERDSQDVLVMQSELAQAIATEIEVRITPQEKQYLSNTRTINPEAYNAYLLGGYLANKRTEASIEKAIEHFQQAIRIDPSYAQAYAGLANAYFEREIWGGAGIGKLADEIRATTLKALELDPNLAEGHALLARIHYQYDWDWQGTEAEYKRAIELNPNLAGTYALYAYFLQSMSRNQEALAAAHRAVELDPLSPGCISDEGRILYRARQYDKAIADFQRALELDPVFLPALSRIVDAYELAQKYDEALVSIRKYEEASGDARQDLPRLARIYARMGKRQEALELLGQIQKTGTTPSNHALASLYAALGDRDRAIDVLEKGVKARSFLSFLLVDPQFDSLRSAPRFQELLRRNGLPS
jgi:TolB-like protein/DNA-binding winged helix-turn-helix (wHTH) protein/cytochrome c-type biogenesis protein CcmH/NrfG